MRGKKIVLGIILCSMMLGMSAPIVANLYLPLPGRANVPASVEQMKAEIAKTIRAAEQAVGGHATAIRLEQSGSKPRWVVDVTAGSNEYDISIERDGGRVSTIVKKTGPAATARTDQGVSPLSNAGGERK